MPIYIQFSAQGQNLNTGKSQIYAMAHRKTAITPGNLRQMGFRMGAESYSSHLPEGGGFGQGVTAPIDSSTGQFSGKRQHSPLVIHIAVDSNSPLLVAALQRNRLIPSLELNLIQTTLQGISRTIGTFNLIDASLAGYGREPVPHDYPKPPPTIKREPPHESLAIHLTFRSISYMDHGGGSPSSNDSWIYP